MADIGHDRDHKSQFTTPCMVMGRSATEGSFSLYDGLADLVQNQGVRPGAVIVAGDVSYGGGDPEVLNSTQEAFRRYMGGHVGSDRVFPLIGNHDVNYLGCMVDKVKGVCHYGTRDPLEFSLPSMSFGAWRENWLRAFPGLSAAIAPGDAGSRWLPPLRYNLDLQRESSVYFIMGLISGAEAVHWGYDTPAHAADGMASGGDAVECEFLRDSLAHGRLLGKTIFIYVTHNFHRACSDWSLIQQIDLWLYGHKHSAWQSPDSGSTVVQERRYYPAKVLLGNGGFDNGFIDVVSFGRLREEPLPGADAGGEDRVRLRLDVYDTCVATACPTLEMECWRECQDVPGGYDGGGGPRRATPSRHGLGFTLEAPQRASGAPVPSPQAPLGGVWSIRLGSGSAARWLTLGRCPEVWGLTWLLSKCLVAADDEADAATFAFYDAVAAGESTSVRLAVVARSAGDSGAGGRGPVLSRGGSLYEGAGFWDTHLLSGEGSMRPSDGWRFNFTRGAGQGTAGTAEGLAWQSRVLSADDVVVQEGSRVEVEFHAPFAAAATEVII